MTERIPVAKPPPPPPTASQVEPLPEWSPPPPAAPHKNKFNEVASEGTVYSPKVPEPNVGLVPAVDVSLSVTAVNENPALLAVVAVAVGDVLLI